MKQQASFDQSRLRPGKLLRLAVAGGLYALAVGQGSFTAQETLLKAQDAPVRTNRWSDPKTWGGHVPGRRDVVVISGKTVILDRNATVAGVVIKSNGVLRFQSSASRTLRSTGNVVVRGQLVMRPDGPTRVHRLIFVDVLERRFVGGGTNPLDSDVGLWVMGAGKLDLLGANRTAWLRTTGGLRVGATSVLLKFGPRGWRVGDEVLIAPTARGDYTPEVSTISAISGARVRLSTGLSKAHPLGPDGERVEIANLTRNVRIEGQDFSHRSHVFIHNTVPVKHTIKNVAIRYMGPRKINPLNGRAEGVLGRYPFHCHINGTNLSGQIYSGIVVRDSGNNGFNAHKSDGITLRDDIVYNWTAKRQDGDGETAGAFTWDVDTETNHSLWDHNLVAYAIPAKITRYGGFQLGSGTGNVIKNSVAFGMWDRSQASGFEWPESNPAGVWGFGTGNVAHNNRHGIFVWQNSSKDHVISNFVGYRNLSAGITAGAYHNCYLYRDTRLADNGRFALHDRALSKDRCGPKFKLRFVRIVMDGGRSRSASALSISRFGSASSQPVLYLDDEFKGYSTAAVLLDGTENANRSPHVDFVHAKVGAAGADMRPSDIIIINPPAGTVIRIQSQDDAWAKQYTPAKGWVDIPPFW